MTMRRLKFAYDLVEQFCKSQGSSSRHLSLLYWIGCDDKDQWKLVLHFSENQSINSKKLLVYVLQKTRRVYSEEEAIGYITRHSDSEGYSFTYSFTLNGDGEDGFIRPTQHADHVFSALSDISSPCECLAQDLSIMYHFPIRIRCCCGVGLIAACQRHAAVDFNRCPLSGLSLGSTYAVVHPSWNQWILKWQENNKELKEFTMTVQSQQEPPLSAPPQTPSCLDQQQELLGIH